MQKASFCPLFGECCLLLVGVLFPARIEYSIHVLSVIHMLLDTNQMCDWLLSSSAMMLGILEYPLAFSRYMLAPCWCNDMSLSAEALVVSIFGECSLLLVGVRFPARLGWPPLAQQPAPRLAAPSPLAHEVQLQVQVQPRPSLLVHHRCLMCASHALFHYSANAACSSSVYFSSPELSTVFRCSLLFICSWTPGQCAAGAMAMPSYLK